MFFLLSCPLSGRKLFLSFRIFIGKSLLPLRKRKSRCPPSFVRVCFLLVLSPSVPPAANRPLASPRKVFSSLSLLCPFSVTSLSAVQTCDSVRASKSVVTLLWTLLSSNSEVLDSHPPSFRRMAHGMPQKFVTTNHFICNYVIENL